MKFSSFLFVVIIFTFNPFLAYATNWYVDKDASGSRNGTSWTNAWTSFSSVIWGSSGVKAGDTLFISGGVTSKTYTEKWTIGASGISGSPITITVDKSNPNHAGQVIFDYIAGSGSSTGNAVNMANRSHVVIDGVDNNRRIKFKNLYNTSNKTACYSISSASTSGSNVVLKYLEFENVNQGIRIDDITGVEVAHCKFIGIRGDAAITVLETNSTGWDENFIHDCEIEILYNPSVGGPDGIQIGTGISVYNNKVNVKVTNLTTSTQHPDMIQANGDYIKVYSNVFTNIGDSQFDMDNSYNDTSPAHIWIYNNIFSVLESIDPYPESIRLYKNTNSWTDVIIANNLFVDSDTGTARSVISLHGSTVSSTSDVSIKNNIFYNCGNGTGHSLIYVETTIPDGVVDIDNNIYYGGTSPYITYRGSSYTTTQWVANYDINGSTSPPIFTSYVERNVNNNYILQSVDTIAKNQGLNLSNYFTTDKNGILRPQGVAWDIGPFEAVEGVGETIITVPRGVQMEVIK